MIPVLDAFLLVPPADVCEDAEAGRLAATEASTAIEGRLRRRLIVQPAAQPVTHGALGRDDDLGVGNWLLRASSPAPAPWARQWPVVRIVAGDAVFPLEAPAGELEGAYYADAVAAAAGAAWDPRLGDETGERLGLPGWPESGHVSYLAGYRRPDQVSNAGRTAVNAAIATLHPAWGSEAISAELWPRVPLLPTLISRTALKLARGFLETEGAGLTATSARSQKRAESESRVQYRAGWDEDLLSHLDHLAWCDL